MGRFTRPRPFLARLLARRGRWTPSSSVAVAACALATGVPTVSAWAQGPVVQVPTFRVNSTTAGNPSTPVVATDAVGNFVIGWSGSCAGGSTTLCARRYAPNGAPLGEEFRVPTVTADFVDSGANQSWGVAADDDGDLVFVWVSGSTVQARRFNASGAPQGASFPVNAITLAQYFPAVAMDADGDFVVVWQGAALPFPQPPNDGVNYGIFVQLFNADGTPRGGTFRVDDRTISVQRSPSVAMDAEGDFTVVWEGSGTGDSYGVFGRRYDATGARVGGEFRVNTRTQEQQYQASVGMDDAGDAVVVWASYAQDGQHYGVYGQRYDADGVAAGAEFLVNTTTLSMQREPAVSMGAAGDFVVAWTQGFGLQDIYGQRYAADGTPRGGEFGVVTAGREQVDPAVAVDADGDFVVTWDDQYTGIYAQRYGNITVATAPEGDAALTLLVVPSPVRDGARVRYTVPDAGPARVAVYDVLGREVARLADGAVAAGVHEATFDTAALAPGVYVVRLESGDHSLVQRVTVAR